MPYQPTWNTTYGQSQQTLPLTSPYQQPINGIVSVNGRDSALQYPLPPNSTSMPLIDSCFDGTRGLAYVVSTDGTGTKTVEVFDLVRHVDEPQGAAESDNWVSREEFERLEKRLNEKIEAMRNGTDGAAKARAAKPASKPAARTAAKS